jgi:LacI family transcriptional regulator
MKKKVSLKDIAQKVGVSIALVSYVLNNKKQGRISEEISKKIRDTAQKLNYRPNQIAKSLKTNKTNTIGLVVADIANPFSSTIARIIEDEAEKNNYTVIVGSSDEKEERSKRIINVMLDRQVDGIIFAPAANDQPLIEYLQKSKVPFVLIDRYFPGLKVNYVAVNNTEASFTGVEHLVMAGCRTIGFIGFKTTLSHLQDRKKGYQSALKKNGITANKSWIKEVPIDTSAEEVKEAIKALLALPKPIDALFFASNKVSTLGLKYINRLGIKVPDDLKILSFDQSDATDLFYATLTHIRQPLDEMGKVAVQTLVELMTKPKKITQIHLPAKLVIGQSTGVNTIGQPV